MSGAYQACHTQSRAVYHLSLSSAVAAYFNYFFFLVVILFVWKGGKRWYGEGPRQMSDKRKV